MARHRPNLSDDREWPFHLSVPQVAKILGISDAKAYQMARNGDLPTIKMGKSIRIPRSRFKEWLDKQSQGGTGSESSG